MISEEGKLGISAKKTNTDLMGNSENET